jgi:5-formyltetrahydrofolate cyclo-ligase
LNKKQSIRENIWKKIIECNVSLFPPPYGRIPNFVGAEVAAQKLSETSIWNNARVIKVSPDSPQKPVRFMALKRGMKVIMPTPRLKDGFLLLDPEKIPENSYEFASTIKGAFFYGKKIKIEYLPKIDLVVVGSVAVNLFGERIGKGGGYSEIEWAIAYEMKKVEQSTPVATTVHDIQVLEEKFDTKVYDLIVDWIITPTRIIKTRPLAEKPRGIYWEMLSGQKVEEIPVLYEMWKNRFP